MGEKARKRWTEEPGREGGGEAGRGEGGWGRWRGGGGELEKKEMTGEGKGKITT